MVVTSFSAGLVTAGAGVISGERRAYLFYFVSIFIIRRGVKCYLERPLGAGLSAEQAAAFARIC